MSPTSSSAPVPESIQRAIAAVEAPDVEWQTQAAERQGRLTMPPESLGRLLALGRQLAGIQRTFQPAGHPALVAVFAADHGVAAAGVSAYPQEVTGQMVANYLRGGAAINVIARRMGAEVRVVDLGVASLPAGLAGHPGLESHPIGPGTCNFLEGPAMTREEAFRAVGTGLALAERWTSGPDGFRVIALGEMGIGNTTAASALISAQLGIPAFRVVGPGTGLDERGVAHKRQVVATAVQLHHDGQLDPWDLLARLGGFEILGLAGLAIGAARARTLIVLDGLISTVAALIADKLCPGVRGSLLAAHVGAEPGHRVVLDHLGMSPLFDLDLRLGEGTGAALALPWVASAADLLRDMATFDDAGVSGRIAPGQSSA